MKIFISWSGDLSRELAEALRDWLPAVLQSVRPFFTPNDIEKGARWGKDISQELETSAFGIFCLTKENLFKPWIMFEAGALSKRGDNSRVCPVLFGLESTDLEGPLVQFQSSPFSEVEIKKLMKTINSALGDSRLEDAVLASVFEMWWPRLNTKVSEIIERYSNRRSDTSQARTDRDIMEEILQLTRLNVSSSNRKLGRLEGFDPDALHYSLKNILNLFESSRGYDRIFSTLLGEVYNPLKYLSERMPSMRQIPDIDLLISKIDIFLRDDFSRPLIGASDVERDK